MLDMALTVLLITTNSIFLFYLKTNNKNKKNLNIVKITLRSIYEVINRSFHLYTFFN